MCCLLSSENFPDIMFFKENSLFEELRFPVKELKVGVGGGGEGSGDKDRARVNWSNLRRRVFVNFLENVFFLPFSRVFFLLSSLLLIFRSRTVFLVKSSKRCMYPSFLSRYIKLKWRQRFNLSDFTLCNLLSRFPSPLPPIRSKDRLFSRRERSRWKKTLAEF